MTNAMLAATLVSLRSLVDDIFAQLDGIPEDDLNHWLPRDGMRDVNTFYVIATHTVGASEFLILEAAGGRSIHRDRTTEFRATGTLRELRARYDRWLEGCADVLGSISEEALASAFERPADPEHGLPAFSRTRAECIVHAVDHMGVHLGHIQLQRQLWDAEHA